mmetsp:Transcript_69072/g.135758  ORF Transcript_69072/g.135758 Transcript_69072/m.135758 type:complete len:441 (+) Transcript_69072:245-1567(+)
MSAKAEAMSLSSIKAVILVSVMLQNALYTLMRRYSQGVLKESVSSAEVLLLSEVFKLFFSGYMTADSKEPTDAHGKGATKLAWLALNSSKMLILALIYAAMNVLSFVALRRIDAAAFTVCAQLKILTTAFFSVLVLQRHLTWTKWRALLLIVCASVLVSTPAVTSSSADCGHDGAVASGGGQPHRRLSLGGGVGGGGDEGAGVGDDDAGVGGGGGGGEADESFETLVGFGAVLLEVTLSGFASIYFEKVIKATNVKLSIWDRNFQLAMYSVLFYVGMISYESATNAEYQLGQGWSVLSVLVAFLGALGGILVALSVKHTDSIMKSIAVSGAIVLASAGGYAFLGGPMTLPMAVGSVVAIIATQNYTFDSEVASGAAASTLAVSSSSSPPAMPTSLSALEKAMEKGSDEDEVLKGGAGGSASSMMPLLSSKGIGEVGASAV